MSLPQPLVSVIVPTYNRPDQLASCLDALAAQSMDALQFEIIVVNDGSSKPVAARLAELVERESHRLQVRLLCQPNSGPATARNAGAEVARADFLAFTDDDCQPQPQWLEHLVHAHHESPDALLGGPLINALPDNVFARATHSIMDYVYADQEERGTLRLYSTSNLAMPRLFFAELSGFDVLFPRAAGEDYDFCARWHDRGLVARFVANAAVYHTHLLGFRSFTRQHFNYGMGLRLMRVCAKHRNMKAWQALGVTRPVHYYLRAILHPVRVDGIRGIPVMLLVVLSQLVTLVGALQPRDRLLARARALVTVEAPANG